MDREINIDSIRSLKEQIREHERAAIKLKRTRNSLLNVSKLPPELLGEIFRLNIAPKSDFDGLDEGSHNFLLVCHHWFEVASRTPDLWCFWGNNPKDWARWCRRPGTAPLDLILDDKYDDYDGGSFSTTLRNILQDRAAQDAIRRVHLLAGDPELLSSIIASLSSDREELRPNRIESFILRNQGGVSTDVSDFFAHYRFPKLQRLDLVDFKISSWNHLTSRTSALTTLVLDSAPPSSIPTTSQLLSILASNPSLRKVELFGCAVPDDGGGKSSTRVQLHQLKKLQLEGGLRHVIGLLHRLDHPNNMDSLVLTLYDSNITSVLRLIIPYLRDHLQRRGKPQNGLNLSISSGYQIAYHEYYIGFQAGDTGGIDRAEANTFVRISIMLSEVPQKSVLERVALDLVACAPLEEVVSFRTSSNPVIVEGADTRFPNLRALSFNAIPLRTAFPNPELIGDEKIFPSLERVSLDPSGMDDGDWSPLMAFLAYRVSAGNRLDTLVIVGSHHMCRQVVEDVRGMVRELKADHLNPRCPSGACRRR